MFSTKLLNVLSHKIKRLYSSRTTSDPYNRTWKHVSNEMKSVFGSKKNKPEMVYPEHADIVIIGGGFIGSSIAYWLKTRAGEGLSVVVLDKDLSFKNNYGNVGLGFLNQHYSLPENIELAQYAAEFLRNTKDYLGQNVNIQYNPHGHLLLASEQYAEKLENNVTLLLEKGFKSELLSPTDIKDKFPWIDISGIVLGSIGSENEGTFNAWNFFNGLVEKSVQLGTDYVNAEVIGFEFDSQKDVLIEGITPGSYKRLYKVKYRTPDNEEYAIKFSSCVLAAGHESANIAQAADIGLGKGLLSVPLPLVKRNHSIYSIKDGAKQTGLNTPCITDTSGLWLQPNSIHNNLCCGHVPLTGDDVKDLSEEEYYNIVIKPSLWNRFPGSKLSEVTRIGTETYTHNTIDDNGIVGPHPYHTNLFLAIGFAKDGCQQGIGIGRAIAELIIDNGYVNTDLTRLGFDRFLINEPLIETNIY